MIRTVGSALVGDTIRGQGRAGRVLEPRERAGVTIVFHSGASALMRGAFDQRMRKGRTSRNLRYIRSLQELDAGLDKTA